MAKQPNWTAEEKQVVLDYFPEWGVRKCKELLPTRPEGSIAKMAQKLGVKCDKSKLQKNIGNKKYDLPPGFTLGSQGYVLILTGRYIDGSKGWTLYHRYVMEQHLGRKLKSTEIVHHIDGNKLNNDITNLELTTRAEHISTHREHINSKR